MSSLGDLAEPFEHQLLTLGEAAQVLAYWSFARLSARTRVPELRWQRSGLPVVRLGEKCLRVRGGR